MFHFPTAQSVEGWLEGGGYILLFTLLFACGLGLPLPEDLPLIAAGALVATGRMHLTIAAAVAWCGIIGGDCVLYMLGRKFGMEVTRLPFIGSHLTAERINRVEKLYEKYGVLVIGVGRMVAGIRGAMVVAAGAIRFPFWEFLLADGIGAVFSGGFFLFVGHWLGRNLDKDKIERFKFWFLSAALVIIAGLIIWILRTHRRQSLEKQILENVDIPHDDSPPARPSTPAGSPALSSVDASGSTAYAESRINLQETPMATVTVQPLPFPSDALEPHIDKQTMEIHHGKHYAAYVANYNKAIEQAPQLAGKPLHEVLANNLALVPEAIKTAVRNNGGGAHNHSLFWQILAPNAGGAPVGKLAEAINSTFGSFDSFKEKFNAAATTRFGSGWAWLIKRGEKLEIISLPNQDSPIMEGAFPVIGLDVWEHAYYLKYQNRRPEYIAAFWNVLNWKEADARFGRAQ